MKTIAWVVILLVLGMMALLTVAAFNLIVMLVNAVSYAVERRRGRRQVEYVYEDDTPIRLL